MQCLVYYTMFLLIFIALEATGSDHCAGSKDLKFMWGDALTDSADCRGPDGQPYPKSTIARAARSGLWGGGIRQGRGTGWTSPQVTVAPNETRSTLLDAYRISNIDQQLLDHHRQSRATAVSGSSCPGAGGRRLCRTRYNTTAPMYGVSLTSGHPVTIVQKFPDLLQQVVFEVCESKKCGVVRGSCTQTYVPYLFLVLPLGPVTLTGQDYVLVESGCVCRTDDDPDIDLASDSSHTSLNSVLP